MSKVPHNESTNITKGTRTNQNDGEIVSATATTAAGSSIPNRDSEESPKDSSNDNNNENPLPPLNPKHHQQDLGAIPQQQRLSSQGVKGANGNDDVNTGNVSNTPHETARTGTPANDKSTNTNSTNTPALQTNASYASASVPMTHRQAPGSYHTHAHDTAYPLTNYMHNGYHGHPPTVADPFPHSSQILHNLQTDPNYQVPMASSWMPPPPSNFVQVQQQQQQQQQHQQQEKKQEDQQSKSKEEQEQKDDEQKSHQLYQQARVHLHPQQVPLQSNFGPYSQLMIQQQLQLEHQLTKTEEGKKEIDEESQRKKQEQQQQQQQQQQQEKNQESLPPQQIPPGFVPPHMYPSGNDENMMTMTPNEAMMSHHHLHYHPQQQHPTPTSPYSPSNGAPPSSLPPPHYPMASYHHSPYHHYLPPHTYSHHHPHHLPPQENEYLYSTAPPFALCDHPHNKHKKLSKTSPELSHLLGPPRRSNNPSHLRDRDINSNDVLCGRGGKTNIHSGNITFRMLVNDYKDKYLLAKKKDKPLIAAEVVDMIRSLDPPGRFLKKDPDLGYWVDVGDQKAKEKASQALREGAPAIRKKLNLDDDDEEEVANKKQKKNDDREEGVRGKENEEDDESKKNKKSDEGNTNDDGSKGCVVNHDKKEANINLLPKSNHGETKSKKKNGKTKPEDKESIDHKELVKATKKKIKDMKRNFLLKNEEEILKYY